MKRSLMLMFFSMLLASLVFVTACDEETEEQNPEEVSYNLLFDYLQNEYQQNFSDNSDYLGKVKLFDDPYLKNLKLEANPYKDITKQQADYYVPDPTGSGSDVQTLRTVTSYDEEKRISSLGYYGYNPNTSLTYEFTDFNDIDLESKVALTVNGAVTEGTAKYKDAVGNGMWFINVIDLTNEKWIINYNEKGYITKYEYTDKVNDIEYLFTIEYTNDNQINTVTFKKNGLELQTDRFNPQDDGTVKRTVLNADLDKVQEDVLTYDTNGHLFLISTERFIDNQGKQICRYTLSGSLGHPSESKTYEGDEEADSKLIAKETYTFDDDKIKQYEYYSVTNGTEKLEDKVKYSY